MVCERESCNLEFSPARIWQRFCSERCNRLWQNAKYRVKHKERIAAYRKAYDSQHFEKREARKRRYKLKYPDRVKLTRKKANKKYSKNNRKKLNDYVLFRRKNNIQFRIAANLRNRVRDALRGEAKTGSAVKDLGCSILDFKIYIENQFSGGMSWDNYGSWHLDHRKPLASFDLTVREDFLKACNYTNLQPLWAKDNFSKGSKIG